MSTPKSITSFYVFSLLSLALVISTSSQIEIALNRRDVRVLDENTRESAEDQKETESEDSEKVVVTEMTTFEQEQFLNDLPNQYEPGRSSVARLLSLAVSVQLLLLMR